MRVDYTRRPSPAEGVAVDPEDDCKVPSQPSGSAVCSEVGLSAWSHSLVPRGSSINWTAYVIRWALFIRVGTAHQEVDSPERRPSSTHPLPLSEPSPQLLEILHQLRAW